MENLSLYESFRSVPENAKKTIQAGRMKGKTDINPMWRIKALTEQFGPCGIGWYYVPVKKWLEACGNEIAALVDIELFVKVGDDWSKPISGTGGNKFSTAEKGGVYVSDECYKMATTDAISVACKQLGIGADVYWNTDATKYDRQTESPEKASNPEVKSAEQTSKSKEKPEMKVGKEHVSTLYNECGRTGIHWRQVCMTYGREQLSDMSMDDFRKAMDIFHSLPNKATEEKAAPAAGTEDIATDEMPWNTPAR